MSTSKHTPGPWRIERRIRTAIYAGQKHIAMVAFFKTGIPETCIGDQEHEANVNLIGAAPGLLDALEFLLAAAGGVSTEATLKARAAIAKAKGDPEYHTLNQTLPGVCSDCAAPLEECGVDIELNSVFECPNCDRTGDDVK